jgi:peptidoglycan/LPS O-acetylase OafA/YrhL
LYIFHYAVLSLMNAAHGTQDQLSGAADLTLYFFSSFALAGAAYTLIERPMQRLRQKFHTPVTIHHS